MGDSITVVVLIVSPCSRGRFHERTIEFEVWQDLIEKNAPFQVRLERIKLLEYIKEAQNLAKPSQNDVSINLMPTRSGV